MTTRKRKRGPGRPPMSAGERRVDVHVRLRPEVLRVIDEFAKAFDITRTEAIERMVQLERALKKREK